MKEIAKALAAAQMIDRLPDYRFTEDGRVITLVGKHPRFMKPIQMGAYVGLQLRTADGGRERGYLHRLICEAFHGPCPDGYECRHLDGDKRNNSAANLAWGTPSENNRDKEAHGTAPIGEKNPMARLTPEIVYMMRKMRAEEEAAYSVIGARFGVSTMTAFRAVSGQSWRTA
jgi:hypothetical protein